MSETVHGGDEERGSALHVSAEGSETFQDRSSLFKQVCV